MQDHLDALLRQKPLPVIVLSIDIINDTVTFFQLNTNDTFNHCQLILSESHCEKKKHTYCKPILWVPEKCTSNTATSLHFLTPA